MAPSRSNAKLRRTRFGSISLLGSIHFEDNEPQALWNKLDLSTLQSQVTEQSHGLLFKALHCLITAIKRSARLARETMHSEDDADEMVRETTVFHDIAGPGGTKFTITSHATQLFYRIRIHFGLSDVGFSEDITCGKGYWQSGSFFFGDSQKRVVFRVVESDEMHRIMRMLPDYSRHLEANRDTMLQQWYGLFTISGAVSKHVLVLGNPFAVDVVDGVFELSGHASLASRSALQAPNLGWTTQRITRDYCVPLSLDEVGDDARRLVRHYDADQYIAEHMTGEFACADGTGERGLRCGVVLRRSERDRLLTQLRADTHFLAGHGILGYTLVVGVQGGRGGGWAVGGPRPADPPATVGSMPWGLGSVFGGETAVEDRYCFVLVGPWELATVPRDMFQKARDAVTEGLLRRRRVPDEERVSHAAAAAYGVALRQLVNDTMLMFQDAGKEPALTDRDAILLFNGRNMTVSLPRFAARRIHAAGGLAPGDSSWAAGWAGALAAEADAAAAVAAAGDAGGADAGGRVSPLVSPAVRRRGGLGMQLGTLRRKDGGDDAVYIKRLQNGMPAADCNLMAVGDRVLAIATLEDEEWLWRPVTPESLRDVLELLGSDPSQYVNLFLQRGDPLGLDLVEWTAVVQGLPSEDSDILGDPDECPLPSRDPSSGIEPSTSAVAQVAEVQLQALQQRGELLAEAAEEGMGAVPGMPLVSDYMAVEVSLERVYDHLRRAAPGAFCFFRLADDPPPPRPGFRPLRVGWVDEVRRVCHTRLFVADVAHGTRLAVDTDPTWLELDQWICSNRKPWLLSPAFLHQSGQLYISLVHLVAVTPGLTDLIPPHVLALPPVPPPPPPPPPPPRTGLMSLGEIWDMIEDRNVGQSSALSGKRYCIHPETRIPTHHKIFALQPSEQSTLPLTGADLAGVVRADKVMKHMRTFHAGTKILKRVEQKLTIAGTKEADAGIRRGLEEQRILHELNEGNLYGRMGGRVLYKGNMWKLTKPPEGEEKELFLPPHGHGCDEYDWRARLFLMCEVNLVYVSEKELTVLHAGNMKWCKGCEYHNLESFNMLGIKHAITLRFEERDTPPFTTTLGTESLEELSRWLSVFSLCSHDCQRVADEVRRDIRHRLHSGLPV